MIGNARREAFPTRARRALAGYALLVRRLRPWYNRWGATQDELRKPLPGDGLAAKREEPRAAAQASGSEVSSLRRGVAGPP